MSSRFRVPKLTSPNVVIRLALSSDEVEAANWLVYRNYINLYWPEDQDAFRRNKYLALPTRHAFVAVDAGRVIGTMSIIKDSPAGLPSDTFRPGILHRYRQDKERLGEVTLFAMDQAIQHPTNLILFFYKFFLQYSFYYLNLDRLVATCQPKHADFYEDMLCFEKLTLPAPYAYASNLKCQFIALPLLRAHLHLNNRYPGVDKSGKNFYRFLYVDKHPNVKFPDHRLRRRSPEMNWLAVARRHDTVYHNIRYLRQPLHQARA